MSLLTEEELLKCRQVVVERDGNKCMWPNCNSPKEPDVHHTLQPRRIDWHNEPEYMICLCRDHHRWLENLIPGKLRLKLRIVRDILQHHYDYHYEDYWQRQIENHREADTELLSGVFAKEKDFLLEEQHGYDIFHLPRENKNDKNGI